MGPFLSPLAGRGDFFGGGQVAARLWEVSVAFAVHPFAHQLAIAAHRLGLLPCASFRWFLVIAAELHLPEDALALHLLLERTQGLLDVIVTNDDLHGFGSVPSCLESAMPEGAPCSMAQTLCEGRQASGARAPGSRSLGRFALYFPSGTRRGQGSDMAILKIARMGHPVLRRPAEPVVDPGAPEIRRLVTDMIETMVDAHGAGLAAPQVHVPLRVVVFHVPVARAEREGTTTVPLTVLINPEIVPVTDVKALGLEACLSV